MADKDNVPLDSELDLKLHQLQLDFMSQIEQIKSEFVAKQKDKLKIQETVLENHDTETTSAEEVVNVSNSVENVNTIFVEEDHQVVEQEQEEPSQENIEEEKEEQIQEDVLEFAEKPSLKNVSFEVVEEQKVQPTSSSPIEDIVPPPSSEIPVKPSMSIVCKPCIVHLDFFLTFIHRRITY